MDTFNYYTDGKLTRQGRRTSGRKRADLLLRFDGELRIRAQEMIHEDGSRPYKKVFLDADGAEQKQCIDTTGNGRFDLVLVRAGNALSETWLDADGDGRADQRDIYEAGVRAVLEIDTNADGRPDVVQRLEGETVAQQDEDSDFDGRIDRRFVGGKPAALGDAPKAPKALPKLDCGRFDAFWKSH